VSPRAPAAPCRQKGCRRRGERANLSPLSCEYLMYCPEGGHTFQLHLISHDCSAQILRQAWAETMRTKAAPSVRGNGCQKPASCERGTASGHCRTMGEWPKRDTPGARRLPPLAPLELSEFDHSLTLYSMLYAPTSHRHHYMYLRPRDQASAVLELVRPQCDR